MSESIATLIGRTRRHIMAMHRPEYNKLGNDVLEADTDMSFARQLKGIAPGSRISIEDEIIYIYETNTNTKSAAVERADLGSVAADHAIDTRVEVNPRFPTLAIRDALREEIQSWPTGLYRTDAIEVTMPAMHGGVDLDTLPSDWTMILNVMAKPRSSGVVFDDRHYKIKFRVERDMSATDYGSTSALFLDTTQTIDSQVLRVVFARPFDVSDMTDAIDTEADIGMPDSVLDIAAMGAAWRLILTRDIYRTFAEGQGETRRAEEVPPMYATQAAAGLQRVRDKRISDEVLRNINRYPWRQMR